MDERSGKIRWQYEAPTGAAVYVGAVDRDHVYAVSLDGGVYAIRQGQATWRVEAGAPIGSVATLSQGTLYVSASGGTVLGIDVASGATRWAVRVEGDPGPAIVDGGRLWVGTDVGVLVELGP
jgi:outer membrane protein assembly factor BamB